MSSSITATGLPQAIAALTKFKTKLPDILQEGMTALAELIIKEAQRIVPVDTGRLKDSIKIMSASATEVKGGTDVEYAGFVEFGTSRQRSQPYMRPAIDKAKKDGPRLVVASIKKML